MQSLTALNRNLDSLKTIKDICTIYMYVSILNKNNYIQCSNIIHKFIDLIELCTCECDNNVSIIFGNLYKFSYNFNNIILNNLNSNSHCVFISYKDIEYKFNKNQYLIVFDSIKHIINLIVEHIYTYFYNRIFNFYYLTDNMCFVFSKSYIFNDELIFKIIILHYLLIHVNNELKYRIQSLNSSINECNKNIKSTKRNIALEKKYKKVQLNSDMFVIL